MRLISWNINGIRAIHKKDALEWLRNEEYDILMFQEIKAESGQFPEELRSGVFGAVFSDSAEKKGYSGVASLTQIQVDLYGVDLDDPAYEGEGRVLALKKGDILIYNIYFPNGQRDHARLEYKMGFYNAFLKKVKADIKNGFSVIVCGDFNTAHKEIDLARTKPNSTRSGVLPIERAWIDEFISAGFVDTFRKMDADKVKYSWWDYKTRARERDVGWRIDYFFVSEDLSEKIISADILTSVMGSDHCPVELILKI